MIEHERDEACRLVVKALLADVQSNLGLMKKAVLQANLAEKHQVDPDDINTEMAFGLWAFANESHWLTVNIKDEALRDSLKEKSAKAYSDMTGIPVNVVGKWCERMELSYQMVVDSSNGSFIVLPLMVYLGYEDVASKESIENGRIAYSPAALLYGVYVTAVCGYWKRAASIYNL